MAILVTDNALHLRTFGDKVAVALTFITIIVLFFVVTVNAERFSHSEKSKNESKYWKKKIVKMALKTIQNKNAKNNESGFVNF